MGSLTKPILLAVVGILAVVLFLQTSNLITGMAIGNNTVNATIPTLITTANVAPTVYDVNFTMIAAGDACANDTTYVHCYGIVNDSNGWENVTSVNATLWNMNTLAGVTSCDTATEKNWSNCYVNASCFVNTSIDDAQRQYDCVFDYISFFAENGTYNCTMWATDGQATASNDSGIQSGNKIRAAMYALNVNDSIDWGAGVIGNKYQQTVFVQNCGNRPIDTWVNGTDMDCTLNSIGVGNITYGTTTSTATTALSSGTHAQINTNHYYPIQENQTINFTTYWNISVPANVGGSCIGNVTFVARES